MPDGPPTRNLDELLSKYDDMMSVEDVMLFLNVSRPTVNKALHNEDDPLPYFKVGKWIRIQKSDLRDWMLRRRST